MTTTSIGSGSDALVLGVSEDAYGGNAQFTVSVDGRQVGGVLTATSLHGSGQSDTVDVLGNWAAGPHTVTINFLNDAWGGSAAKDRNLYLDRATYNGAAVSGAAAALPVSGPHSFGLTDPGSTVVWSGLLAPQPRVNPGDTLDIAGSTFAAQGSQLSGVTVDLTGSQASPAGLAVQNGSIGKLDLVPSAGGDLSIPQYGKLTVTGIVTIQGALQSGGRPAAPGALAVTVGGGATLNLNGGQLADGASLVITGPAATVNNAGILSLANTRQFAIHADLAGAGTIQSLPTAASSGVAIELDGAVSAAQTVRLDGGTLQLDQPMRFMGTVAGFTTSAPGGPASCVRLAHARATGASFQQGAGNAGTLSVSMQDPATGAAGTAVIHVAGSFASNAFVFTNDAATQSALIRLAPL